MAARRADLPAPPDRRPRLHQRMRGRPRHRQSGDRFDHLQPCPRPAAIPPCAQPLGPAGCRLGRIPANASAIATGNAPMIEAEWWEYDSLDELAEAVAGDVAFIVDSAL